MRWGMAGPRSLALAAAILLPRIAEADDEIICEGPQDCPNGAVCVGWQCLSGSRSVRVESLYTIAVPEPVVSADLPWLKDAGERTGEALREYLDWTGFYEVVPRDDFPNGSLSEGVSPVETRRPAWHGAGVWRVVKTSLHPDRDPHTFRLRIRLVEVERYGTIDLAEGDVVVRPGGERWAAARWVNALVAHDTGLAASAGSQVAVSVEVRPGVKEIGVMDATGSGLQLVTDNGSLNLGPTWGPRGRIGYMSYWSGNSDWVVDGFPFSTRPGLNVAGSWSPDGKWLALSIAEGDNSDLFILYGDTGEESARLTSHPGVDTSPIWSPDGKRLVFVSDRTGRPQIWTMTLDGSSLEKLTSGGYATSPDWSPNGLTIVYALQLSSDHFGIMRYDLDTGETRRISPEGGSSEGPTFSPCGRYIMFTRRLGDAPTQLWIMNADGSRARPVGGSDDRMSWPMFSPDWRKR